MKLKGAATLKCESCDEEMTIDASTFDDFENVNVGPERGMGVEVTHTATFYSSCDKCNTEISGDFIYIEYPPGSFNYEGLESVTNAEVKSTILTAL